MHYQAHAGKKSFKYHNLLTKKWSVPEHNMHTPFNKDTKVQLCIHTTVKPALSGH